MPFRLAISLILVWVGASCIVSTEDPVKSLEFDNLTIQYADVMLAIDCSTGVLNSTFKKVLTDRIDRTLILLNISSHDVRVAVYGVCQSSTDNAVKEPGSGGLLLSLANGTSYNAVRAVVDTMKQSTSFATPWDQALSSAKDRIFLEQNGARSSARKVVLLVGNTFHTRSTSPLFVCKTDAPKGPVAKFLSEFLERYGNIAMVVIEEQYPSGQPRVCTVSAVGGKQESSSVHHKENVSIEHGGSIQDIVKYVSCGPVRKTAKGCPQENACPQRIRYLIPGSPSSHTPSCPKRKYLEVSYECSTMCVKEDGKCGPKAAGGCRVDVPKPKPQASCPGNVPPDTCRNLDAVRNCNLSGHCETGPMPECTALAYAERLGGVYHIKRGPVAPGARAGDTNDVTDKPVSTICGNISTLLKCYKWWWLLKRRLGVPIPCGPEIHTHNCTQHGESELCRLIPSERSCQNIPESESVPMDPQHYLECVPYLSAQKLRANPSAQLGCKGWRAPPLCALADGKGCETLVPKERLCVEPAYQQQCLKDAEGAPSRYCNGPKTPRPADFGCYKLVYETSMQAERTCRFISVVQECFTWALRFHSQPCPVMPESCSPTSGNLHCTIVNSTLNDNYEQQCKKFCVDHPEISDACEALFVRWMSLPKRVNKQWPCIKVILASGTNQSEDRPGTSCIDQNSESDNKTGAPVSIFHGCSDRIKKLVEKECKLLGPQEGRVCRNYPKDDTRRCFNRLLMTNSTYKSCRSRASADGCSARRAAVVKICGMLDSTVCTTDTSSTSREARCSSPNFQYSCLHEGSTLQKWCNPEETQNEPPDQKCYGLLYGKPDDPHKLDVCRDEYVIRTCIDWLISQTSAKELENICPTDVKPSACLEPMQPEFCYKMRPKKYHDCQNKCSSMNMWHECVNASRGFDTSTRHRKAIDLCTPINPPECSKPKPDDVRCFQKAPGRCAELFKTEKREHEKIGNENLCNENISEIQYGTCLGWLLATGKSVDLYPCKGPTHPKRGLIDHSGPCNMACLLNHISTCETSDMPNELCGEEMYQTACLADTASNKSWKAEEWCMKEAGAKGPPPGPECYNYYFKPLEARVTITEYCDRMDTLSYCLPWFTKSVKTICRGGPKFCEADPENPICTAVHHTPLSTEKACETLCMPESGNEYLDKGCQGLIKMNRGTQPPHGNMTTGPCEAKNAPKGCKEDPFNPRCFNALNSTSPCAEPFLVNNTGTCSDLDKLLREDCYTWWKKVGLSSDPCNGTLPVECLEPSPTRKQDCLKIAKAGRSTAMNHTMLCEDKDYRSGCPGVVCAVKMKSPAPVCELYNKAPNEARQEMCTNETIMRSCAKLIFESDKRCVNGVMPNACHNNETRPDYCRFLSPCAEHFLANSTETCGDLNKLLQHLNCYQWWKEMGWPSDPCNGSLPAECLEASPKRKEDCLKIATAGCTTDMNHIVLCDDNNYRSKCPLSPCPKANRSSVCEIYNTATVKDQQKMCTNETVMRSCAEFIYESDKRCVNGVMPDVCHKKTTRPDFCRYLGPCAEHFLVNNTETCGDLNKLLQHQNCYEWSKEMGWPSDPCNGSVPVECLEASPKRKEDCLKIASASCTTGMSRMLLCEDDNYRSKCPVFPCPKTNRSSVCETYNRAPIEERKKMCTNEIVMGSCAKLIYNTDKRCVSGVMPTVCINQTKGPDYCRYLSPCVEHFLVNKTQSCTNLNKLLKYQNCFDWWKRMGWSSDPCNGSVPAECLDASPKRKEDCLKIASAGCTTGMNRILLCDDKNYRFSCPHSFCAGANRSSACDIYKKAPITYRQELCKKDEIMRSCAKLIFNTDKRCVNGVMPLVCHNEKNRPDYCRYLSGEAKKTNWWWWWWIAVVVAVILLLAIIAITVTSVVYHKRRRSQVVPKAKGTKDSKAARMTDAKGSKVAKERSPKEAPDPRHSSPKAAAKAPHPKTKQRDATVEAAGGKGVSYAGDLSLTDVGTSQMDTKSAKTL